jgi:hypothetical protein
VLELPQEARFALVQFQLWLAQFQLRSEQEAFLVQLREPVKLALAPERTTPT